MGNGTILIVDDDRIMVAMLETQLKARGYHTILAYGGEEGVQMARLHAGGLDAIVLDRVMPGTDGLAVIRHFKKDPELLHVPIIMQTGSDSPDEVREGIDAGVFYYLTKPVQESVLQSVLAAAMRERTQRRLLMQEQLRQHQGFTLIDTARFHYRTLDEAEAMAIFVANCFPDPRRCVSGLAELMINAVEHGNLGIGYDLKSALIENGLWRSEISRRSELTHNVHKQVEVLLQRKPDGVYCQITDEGEGFHWQTFLMIDPSRTTDNHGRGIAQARAQSFDAIRYNSSGNQVLAIVYYDQNQTQALDW